MSTDLLTGGILRKDSHPRRSPRLWHALPTPAPDGVRRPAPGTAGFVPSDGTPCPDLRGGGVGCLGDVFRHCLAVSCRETDLCVGVVMAKWLSGQEFLSREFSPKVLSMFEKSFFPCRKRLRRVSVLEPQSTECAIATNFLVSRSHLSLVDDCRDTKSNLTAAAVQAHSVLCLASRAKKIIFRSSEEPRITYCLSELRGALKKFNLHP